METNYYMENTENIKCPFCRKEIKKGNGRHIHDCKIDFEKSMSEDYKNDLRIKYMEEGYSMLDMAIYMGYPSSIVSKILKDIGIPLRNIKEAASQKRTREKYKTSCIERFGTPHNFSKDCPSRKAWENRLLEEEGITNVFQRDDVKAKIKDTMLSKYGGEKGVKKVRSLGSQLEHYIEKYGEELGSKIYEDTMYRRGSYFRKSDIIEKYGEIEGTKIFEERLKKQDSKFNHNNGLNKRCEDILIKNNISYDKEYHISNSKIKSEHFYSYDFKIGNILLELNGDYWHCNPIKYKENDLVKFPNNLYILAKDKWEYDKKKIKYGEDNGFKVISIWEMDFSEEYLLEKLKECNYEMCKD